MLSTSMATSDVGINEQQPSRSRVEPSSTQELYAFRIAHFTAHAFIAPSERVVSSFGARSERGALLVSLTDENGCTGWGEVWCGMPAAGALHRFNLLREFVAPALVGCHVTDISSVIGHLQAALMPLITLAGEPGPVSQVLAGVDCALWDLRARIAGQPLFKLLGSRTNTMRCYASGLAPDMPAAGLDALRSQGHRAFKFKAGFDDAKTLTSILDQGSRLAPSERMMVDANCGWTMDEALDAVAELNQISLEWIEEPMSPHRSEDDWERLARASVAPLAGGENLLSEGAFREACRWLGVIQPDVAKWGGVSSCHPMGVGTENAGRLFCPHSFGTHIAAATSAHVLAATGGRGYAEIDVNPNPLRDSSSYASWIDDGFLRLPTTPGIGVVPHLARIDCFLRDRFELSYGGRSR
ncbi:mandelate racemase/muconate lactonizing enzyme family protein [Ottowia thiooxydans]|uniref:mandelate racemase/muconate lactonizing enzyme family protein n=1 Tax=Ottowia thiooxydans TaxID=219182 RepID=UPI00042643A5|nr:mandelate racemase/muconate lactonizing enzyme family protein [Ottowia thiooxydans]